MYGAKSTSNLSDFPVYLPLVKARMIPQGSRHERKLPPLRDVLGDVLELTSWPSPQSSPNDILRNVRHNPVLGHERPVFSEAVPRTPASGPTSLSCPLPRFAISEHSYHIFNYTPDEGLVHQLSSSRHDVKLLNHKRFATSDPGRKYVCAQCGNRFSRHSTLKNHLLTHTGEKPYICGHPGCGRQFSISSNMQRHMHTHKDERPHTLRPTKGNSGAATPPSSSQGTFSSGESSREGSI